MIRDGFFFVNLQESLLQSIHPKILLKGLKGLFQVHNSFPLLKPTASRTRAINLLKCVRIHMVSDQSLNKQLPFLNTTCSLWIYINDPRVSAVIAILHTLTLIKLKRTKWIWSSEGGYHCRLGLWDSTIYEKDLFPKFLYSNLTF